MPEAHGTASTGRVEELFSLGCTVEVVRLLPRFCQVSQRTLGRWLENFERNGTIRDPWKKRKRARCEHESGNLSPALGDFVLNLLKDDPCLHLREIQDEMKCTTN
uniref:Uncharacterized protein n=1 Tax=Lotharella oceanica TaxID=641309 RepID=A0A7S2TYM4_9EUKA